MAFTPPVRPCASNATEQMTRSVGSIRITLTSKFKTYLFDTVLIYGLGGFGYSWRSVVPFAIHRVALLATGA